MENESVYFDADGQFTDEFRTQLPELVGDSYNNEDGTPTKVFDDVKNFPALLKTHLEINRKFGQKQDNVIQKPGDNASETEKSDYVKVLAGEMGLSATVEDLKFEHGDIPDGMEVKEKMEAGFKELVVKEEIPTRYANVIMKWFNGVQAADFTTDKETKLKEFTEASDKFNEDFPGDKGIENNRIAFNAMRVYHQHNPDMIKALDESGVFDDPANLGLWKSIGIMPEDLAGWGIVGDGMGVSSSPAGGVHEPGGGGSLQEQVNAMYPNTPDELKKVNQ